MARKIVAARHRGRVQTQHSLLLTWLFVVSVPELRVGQHSLLLTFLSSRDSRLNRPVRSCVTRRCLYERRRRKWRAGTRRMRSEEVPSSRKVRCEMHQLPPIVCVSCCPSSSSLFCLDMLLLQVDPGGHVLVASHQERHAGKEETGHCRVARKLRTCRIG